MPTALFCADQQSYSVFVIDLPSAALLAATARTRIVASDVPEHLLPFGFRRSFLSQLNHGSDFFTEFLRQFFKCWTIEERRAFGWVVIPPLGNPPVGVISDLVFRFDLTVLQQFGKLLQSLSSPISSTGTPSMVNSA